MTLTRYAWLMLVTSGLLIFPGLPGAAAGPDDALTPKRNTPSSAKSEVEGFWNVDSILDTAVKNLGRRYNLNENQLAFTDQMMKTRVNAFLDQHQSEIWPLIRDLALHQRIGTLPDPDTASRLGPKALRMLAEAKKQILQSNEEWRGILSPAQRKVHDYDLRDMDQKFAAMEKNFSSWAEGNPTKGGIFPDVKPVGEQPKRPPRPKDGHRIKTDGSVARYDSLFDAYVRNFIAKYELNAGQVKAAHSILREIKQRAAAIAAGQKEKLAQIESGLKAARVERKTEKIRKWTAARRKLLKPMGDLLVELKDRLQTIPDEAQRERAENKSSDAKRSPGRRGESGKSSKPASGSGKDAAPDDG